LSYEPLFNYTQSTNQESFQLFPNQIVQTRNHQKKRFYLCHKILDSQYPNTAKTHEHRRRWWRF